MDEDKYVKISLYDYFKLCLKHTFMRGAGIVTNKQFIYVFDPENNYVSHNEMATELEKAICPYLTTAQIGWGLCDHVHLYSIVDDFIIDLPESGELSTSQVEFIERALDDIEKVNEERPENRKIQINCFTHKRDFNFPITSDAEIIKKKLGEFVTKKVSIRTEKIVGMTLNKEEIKEKLMFHLTFEDCKTLSDVKKRIHDIGSYYYDDFYSEAFNELFPNYFNVLKLVICFEKLNCQDEEVPLMNLTNIETTLNDMLNNFLKNESGMVVSNNVNNGEDAVVR